jgi:hypothetical protein
MPSRHSLFPAVLTCMNYLNIEYCRESPEEILGDPEKQKLVVRVVAGDEKTKEKLAIALQS